MGGPAPPGPGVLDLADWARQLDPADEAVLRRCVGPVLDIGCGPGRMVLEASARGLPALGIDLVPEAVNAVQASGGLALRRSVFGPLPGEGRWRTVLLLDGCVGIGGMPDILLTRVSELLHPRGVAFVEHCADPDREEQTTVRIRDQSGSLGPTLAWSVIGRHALAQAAKAADLVITDSWNSCDRHFAGLRRSTTEDLQHGADDRVF